MKTTARQELIAELRRALEYSYHGVRYGGSCWPPNASILTKTIRAIIRELEKPDCK